jgi:BMFP domain-containing protein YqiC
MKKDFVSEFFDQASKMLPPMPSRDELQKSLHAVAQSTLSKLELVTREEFDAQTAVLERTRTRLEQLEKQLQQLSEELAKR